MVKVRLVVLLVSSFSPMTFSVSSRNSTVCVPATAVHFWPICFVCPAPTAMSSV